MLGILWGAEYLQKWADRRGGDGRWFRLAYRALHVVLCGSIVWRLAVLHRDWRTGGAWFDPDVL